MTSGGEQLRPLRLRFTIRWDGFSKIWEIRDEKNGIKLELVARDYPTAVQVFRNWLDDLQERGWESSESVN
jgi:hypothetical protein